MVIGQTVLKLQTEQGNFKHLTLNVKVKSNPDLFNEFEPLVNMQINAKNYVSNFRKFYRENEDEVHGRSIWTCKRVPKNDVCMLSRMEKFQTAVTFLTFTLEDEN